MLYLSNYLLDMVYGFLIVNLWDLILCIIMVNENKVFCEDGEGDRC